MAVPEGSWARLERWIIVSEDEAAAESGRLALVDSQLVFVDLTEVVFIHPDHVEALFGKWLRTLQSKRPRVFCFFVSTVATQLALERLSGAGGVKINVIWAVDARLNAAAA